MVSDVRKGVQFPLSAFPGLYCSLLDLISHPVDMHIQQVNSL